MVDLALDTNIVIAILNNEIRIEKKFPAVKNFFLPITVCGELLFGARNSARKKENEEGCWNFIRQTNILNNNLLVAEEYAFIRKELKDSGRPIPENDIWIAAACRANQIPLCSRDKHFRFIDNLTIKLV